MNTPAEWIRKLYQDADHAQELSEDHQRLANEYRHEAEQLRSAASIIETKYGIVYTGESHRPHSADAAGRGAFETALEVFEQHRGEVLTLAQIQALMFKAGWKTDAKDPSATVRNTVGRLREQGVESVARGKYRLKLPEADSIDLRDNITSDTHVANEVVDLTQAGHPRIDLRDSKISDHDTAREIHKT